MTKHYATATSKTEFGFFEGLNAFGWFFSVLISIGIFGYVFLGLFSTEQPIFSTIFALFAGAVAAALASPITAATGFLFASIISGALATANRLK